jgi:hypothetical protein
LFASYSAEKIKITFLWWLDPVGGFEEKFAKQGWLVPLDDWFGEEERKEFLPGDI